MKFKDILKTIQENFPEEIDKKQLIDYLRIKEPNERYTTPYRLFTWEQIEKDKNLEQLSYSDRTTKIDILWRENPQLHNDKVWYETTLERKEGPMIEKLRKRDSIKHMKEDYSLYQEILKELRARKIKAEKLKEQT